ncbi:MAG: hypothetical protein A3B15_00775 [Candidatus Buchananbacteria bacterium RIFCSPLOWO2_01_FULL_45_31]|uniref:Transposase n=1 Tax=Candidatus Buchananbacteria bacterium RIFCSPLOWO2_01_FULL_45_31 TaxID=1797545 RepID=A0A1G1YQ12_9BACT|nr:MAG: hypothetical protein A3B15_00775 [Candidatus Buchananbacteria bacterium RIFCSPLOWO2_01_FULL_45_31]
MFKDQDQFTNSLFGSYAYDPIIRRNQDHFLVKINKLINWSFVEDEVAGYYSNQGQKAIHPLRMFKLLIIQNLHGLSDRDTMSNTDCNIIFRYFVGLGLTEDVPHWTELGKFKERIGVDAFERLFYRVLKEAERLGIEISDKRNADSTDVAANVDLQRCVKNKRDKNDKTYVDRNTTDQDAKFGRKESNGKGWYGYKSHANDDVETGLVTAVITTGANKTDESQLIELVDKERRYRGEGAIRKQGGDKGYVGHAKDLEARNILDYTIPRDNMKTAKAKKDGNKHFIHLKKLRYKVEQKFAEAKRRHGLGKTRFRGKWKVHLNCLIVYLTINLKRIIKLLIPKIA